MTTTGLREPQACAIVGGVATQRPRAHVRKPRLKSRKLFAASIDMTVDPWIVEVRRGAFVTSIDKEGNVIVDRQLDPTAYFAANIGDRFMAFGRPVDDIAIFVIVRIEQTGYRERLRVRCVTGSIAETTAIQLMSARGLG